jgi:hypothetical protein
MPLWSRLSTIAYSQLSTTADLGKSQMEACRIADEDLPKLEKELDAGPFQGDSLGSEQKRQGMKN